MVERTMKLNRATRRSIMPTSLITLEVISGQRPHLATPDRE